MEEIDISQLLNYFKSKVIYILFAMSIAFCLSSIYVNRFRVPEYTSSTTILLNQANENASISTNDISLNKSLVTTYSEIIKSKRVLRQIIELLDLDMEYSELASKVAVGEVTDTSIIRISVTDADSKLAADIANSIATVFTKEIVEIYKLENISIIDEAEVSEEPSSASTMKIIGIATIAGAILSVAVIFVVFYFDTTIKNEEDIEKATGLPVIGIVPASREKIKYSAHRKYYDDLAKKHRSNEILPVEREVRKIEVTTEINENEVAIQAKESIVEPEIVREEIVADELEKTNKIDMKELQNILDEIKGEDNDDTLEGVVIEELEQKVVEEKIKVQTAKPKSNKNKKKNSNNKNKK